MRRLITYAATARAATRITSSVMIAMARGRRSTESGRSFASCAGACIAAGARFAAASYCQICCHCDSGHWVTRSVAVRLSDYPGRFRLLSAITSVVGSSSSRVRGVAARATTLLHRRPLDSRWSPTPPWQPIRVTEPPRVVRRLRTLEGWSHGREHFEAVPG